MANEWLDNLKVGDTVIIDGGLGEGSEGTVERFTSTMIVTDCGRRYRRKDGWAPGSGWRRGFLNKPTQERLDRITHSRWVGKLRHYKWADESLETLAKIVIILTDGKK